MTSDNSFDSTQNGLDWQEYYHAVRKRLWIVILCLVLGGVGATLYMNSQPRIFQARSVLFISQTPSTPLEGKVQTFHGEEILSLDMINTVVDVLRSHSFAERVAARLKLQKDPRFLNGLISNPASDLTAADAASLLVPHVMASYRTRTRLIDIYITHPDATMATELANAYAEEYLRYGVDRRTESNKVNNQFLVDESEKLKKQLAVSEDAMQSFREREKAPSLDDMEQASKNKLTEYTKNISDIESRLFQLDNDLKIASATPGDPSSFLRLPSVASQPRVAEISQIINESERQFALLKQRYRPAHPAYKAAQTQLESLQHDRNQLLQDVVNLLRGERQRLNAQHDELKKAKADEEDHMLEVTRKSVKYNELKRDLDTNRKLYDSVTGRLAEGGVVAGMSTSSVDAQVEIHEKALAAGQIVVNALKVYGVGLAVGLFLGLVIALALHFMDYSVKTVDQAESISGVPVLAAVPRKSRSNARSLDVVQERNGLVAESFRSLRTTLAMAVHANERRSFVFTSAVPSEGKTFCSSNFSATLSQQGFKTLLIDADLRRPMVSRVFFGEHRRPGLADVLTGTADLSTAIYPTAVENLFIFPAGTRAPNPAELLATSRLREILQQALLLYDRVVVDTAPVLAVSDALLVAPHVDVVCLVLRSFKTPRKTFLRAMKSLEEIHCLPSGVVLNFMPTGSDSYYYYSGKHPTVYGEKGVYGA